MDKKISTEDALIQICKDWVGSEWEGLYKDILSLMKKDVCEHEWLYDGMVTYREMGVMDIKLFYHCKNCGLVKDHKDSI